MITLGVLVSGSGSNFQAIIDAIAAGTLDARIAIVISNTASAGGLERARAAGIASTVIDHRGFSKRSDFDAALAHVLREHLVDYVVLAGFMRVVTETLLGAFPMRVVNIHPSLLPSFTGQNAQAQALAYGARIAGCTVHFVDAGTDTGPILAQTALGIASDDTEESLRARILTEEHRLLPTVLQWLSEGRVTVTRDAHDTRPRVVVTGADTFRFAATPTRT